MLSHKAKDCRIYIFTTKEEAMKFADLFDGLVICKGRYVTI